MKSRAWLLAVVACAFLAAPCAQALNVGDRAPNLSIDEWIKNPQPNVFDGEKIEVIENWASWCGTCYAVEPVLSQLQATYPDKVRVMGFSYETIELVREYVAGEGDRMSYSVGRDIGSIWMSYKDGFYSHATVVNQARRVVWRGESWDLPGAVAQAVASGVFVRNKLSNLTLTQGDALGFSLDVDHAAPVNYAWTFKGQPIGGNSPTLSIPHVTAADEGLYACTVTSASDPTIAVQRSAWVRVYEQGAVVPAMSPWGTTWLLAMLSAFAVRLVLQRREAVRL
jgi:thiol-disulfide isomerase/thioredoxin